MLEGACDAQACTYAYEQAAGLAAQPPHFFYKSLTTLGQRKTTSVDV